MDLKQIRKIPFEKFSEKSRIRWKVTAREPVINGERLLLVDFLSNPSCTSYLREDHSFRIVCSKKKQEVMALDKDGKSRIAILDRIYTVRSDYALISEREEKRLFIFFGKKGTQNHQLDNLVDWVQETRKEMKRRDRQKRGELMDEDYRLCPEALPEGLLDFIRREIFPEDNTLLYRKGNVRGFCYLCGEEVRGYGRQFKQSAIVHCPNCGQTVICALDGGESYRANYVDNVVMAQKGSDGETVFFRQWQIQRDTTQDNGSIWNVTFMKLSAMPSEEIRSPNGREKARKTLICVLTDTTFLNGHAGGATRSVITVIFF